MGIVTNRAARCKDINVEAKIFLLFSVFIKKNNGKKIVLLQKLSIRILI